ncbi:MAG: discoidin domain-containing protein [Candidatus Korobacteraceae bacterium]|jgi:F5/8 type C domain-containing protein
MSSIKRMAVALLLLAAPLAAQTFYGGDAAPHAMTSDSAPSPYVASCSSSYSDCWHAFDGAVGSNGQGWLGQTGGTGYLQIYLGSGNAAVLVGYGMMVETDDGSPVPRAPKTWTLQGSNDNSTWTTLDTETNITGWLIGVAGFRTFPSSGSTAYRYFQVNITANNGDSSYTGISELFLYTEKATVGGGGGCVIGGSG